MRKIYSIATALLFYSIMISAQPTFQFVKGIYGETHDVNHGGSSILNDSAGNIFMAGDFQGSKDFDPNGGIFAMTSIGFKDGYFAKYSSTGNLVWVKQLGGASKNCHMGNIVMDASSNLYITGKIDGPVDFDPGAGITTLTNDGSTNWAIFIAKYSPSGTLIWAKSYTNTGTQDFPKITISNSNSLYLTGQIGSGGADFDFGPGTLFVGGNGDAFVAKYDLNASVKWAFSMNSATLGVGLDIVADANACYVTGQFYGYTDFDPSPSVAAITSSLNSYFLAKYDSLGNYVFAEQIGIGASTPSERANIDLDMSGNIYYSSTWGGINVDFDPGPANALLSSVNGYNMVIAKYDNMGNYIFAKSTTGSVAGSSAYPTDIAVGYSGAIYITGTYYGTENFDTGVGTNDLFAPSGQHSGFLAKYDLSGNYLWTFGNQLSTTTQATCGKSISLDGTYIYWASDGGRPDMADFDPGPPVGTYIGDFISGQNQFSKYSDCSAAPIQPTAITGTTSICSSSSNTYSITAVAGATSYTWTLPSGWAGTSTTNSISTTASSTSGNITVTANNSCGTSTVQTIAVTVNTSPATPGTISGTTSMCIGAGLQTYSVTSIAGATSYTWTLPSGWSGASVTNSISATPGSTSGNITVTANNTCGNSAPQTVAVVVNPLPIVTYTQSPALVCINATSVSLTGGLPSGGNFSGTSVSGSTFNASAAGMGTYSITYTYTDANSCTNMASSNIMVDACTGLYSTTSSTQELIVFPNPTNGFVTIILNEAKGTHLILLNVLGEKVYEIEMTSAKTELDLSKLNNGIYFLQVQTDEGLLTKKITKQ